MANPDDELTRPTRRATVASAVAVSAYTLLWLLSTQVDAVRSISPFADDPWDAIATYAAIFLVFVAGSTWIRALGHRERVLAAGTASRLRWGSGLAAALVLAAAGADLQAIIATGFRPDAGAAAVVLGGLVGVSVLAATMALWLARRAAALARVAPAQGDDLLDPAEPDIVDDLLELAVEIAGRVGDRARAERLAAAIESILDRAPWSPRRHPIAFGLLVAVAAGLAFAVWHGIREGAPVSLVVPLVFTVLVGGGVFAAWLGTVRPLRILRPPAG